MILSESTSSICKTSCLTDVHYQNLTLGVVRRMSLELWIDNALWALCVKSKRKDALSPKVHDFVVQIWTKINQVNPNKIDVIKKRTSIGKWEAHATHFLTESQVILFIS